MKNLKNLYFIALIAILFSCGKTGSQESSSGEAAEEAPKEAKIVGKQIFYSTDTTQMNGYLAYNENATDKSPGILVIHEWWGHNDYARERADMLAELGYVALAVDMYGDGAQANHPDDAMGFVMSVMGNFDEAKLRFEKAIETLQAQPGVDPDRIGAIGYCFGGTVALTMANAGYDLDAVAAFHSGLQMPVMPGADSIRAKILVCNGADDPFIPAEQVTAFKAALDSAGADYQYESYEGAVHSFTSQRADSIAKLFDMPLAYNAEADQKSWQAMQDLFERAF